MVKRRKNLSSIDPSKILSEKVAIKSGDETLLFSPDEVARRHLINRAIKGDMNAAKRIIKECFTTGILARTIQTSYSPSKIIIPDHWDRSDWHAMYEKRGLPPWPGEDDGFSEECRAEHKYWRKHGHHSWVDEQW